jgi:adenylate cyclase
VLPFTNASGDASLDSLGPSLAREISAMLSTYPMFRIVSPSGLPAQGAQDIGRRYALDGDLLKSGEKLRVRVRLTDAASGQTVWSGSYDFPSGDSIAIQKQTAERIYSALAGNAGRLLNIEQEASWRKSEPDLTEYDYYLRSMTYIMKFTYDNALRARKVAEDGLKRFPDSANLKIRLGYSYLLESVSFGPFENCHETIDTAFKLGREAEEAKNKSRFEIYQTRRFMAHAYAWHGEEFDRAIDDAEATVEMAPNDAADRAQFAGYLAGAGQFDKALDWVSWAIAHNYQDLFWIKAGTAWIYYLAGRYEEGLTVLKGVEATHPWPLIVIYAGLGRMDEARAATVEYVKTGPHSVLAESCAPLREPMKQKYLDDLRKAGLPERAERASP